MAESVPLVSVISAYYNRENHVEESIQSLLDQTYENLEIIIVDDGSTDNTLERLKRFNDPRLKIVSHKNCGLVMSFIRAIEMSNGEYIAIHGSGDLSLPQRIEKQAALLQEKEKVGVVGCYVNNINTVTGYEMLREIDVSGHALEQLKVQNAYTHGEVMYRRSVYDQVGGYRTFFKFGQDYDLWLRMSLVTELDTVKEILYTRFQLADGVELSVEKKAMQIFLSDFAIQCIDYRLEHGRDLLDVYQERAAFMRKPSPVVAQKLHVLSKKVLFQRQIELAQKLNAWSVREYRGLPNSLIQGFTYIASKNPWLEKHSFDLLFRVRKFYQGLRSGNAST